MRSRRHPLGLQRSSRRHHRLWGVRRSRRHTAANHALAPAAGEGRERSPDIGLLPRGDSFGTRHSIMTYPDDADGDALRRVADSGIDMTKPMTLDFFIAVPNSKVGAIVASRATSQGYETSVERDSENGEWTCYCTRRLIPTYDAVVGAQDELLKLAADLDGCVVEGWGTLGE